MLIQVTRGCSYNKCTFCSMYQDVEFKVRTADDIKKDLAEASTYRFKRIFLCDGEALVAPQPLLVEVLKTIRTTMPFVERVGLYADCRSILKKKPAELKQLADLGLGIIYHGIESGDDRTLRAIKKGTSAAKTIEAGKRVKDAGILYSAIVLLGIAGRQRSLEHAVATAEVLNAIQPDFVGVLTTMVVEDTPLWDLAEQGKFIMPAKLGLIEELKTLLENLALKRSLLTTKHSSNYLSLRIVFPYERQRAIDHLEHLLANADTTVLRPDCLRGL
jgi:radical SAM superfamily enzyme YgiQ (UPF0313 family)